MSNLAVFDLDHTLINTDSDRAFVDFLIEKGLLDKDFAAAENARFYRDYQNGCLDVREFVAFQMRPLRRFRQPELDALHQEFTERMIRPYITQMARMLVQAHREAGDTLLVISSTNEFIISPICRLFGIENIIGTRLQRDADGCYTGVVEGIPSLREGKITRLNEWLAARGESRASYGKMYFYSDSHNDLPLLELADEAVAVNPDEALRRHAQQRGWEILMMVA